MSNRYKAHSAVLLANIIYGVNFFAVKEVVPFIHPYALAVYRAGGALILLWIVGLYFKSVKIEKKDMWKMIVAGVLGISINQTLLVTGIYYTSSINASVIMTSNPLFVVIFSALLLKIRITPITLIGIIIGASGALLAIASRGEIDFNSNTFLGDIIILANAVMYALYLVWVKPLMEKYDSYTVMKWMFLTGFFPVFIFGFNEFQQIDMQVFNIKISLLLGFIVIAATFLTYLLNVYGLKYVNPSTVSIYIYLQPLITAFLIIIFDKGNISIINIISMLLVFLGVYIVSLKKKKLRFFNSET